MWHSLAIHLRNSLLKSGIVAHPDTLYNLLHLAMLEYGDIGEETLRDKFASSALQGLLSDGHSAAVPTKQLVRWSYEMADAMMAERGTSHEK